MAKGKKHPAKKAIGAADPTASLPDSIPPNARLTPPSENLPRDNDSVPAGGVQTAGTGRPANAAEEHQLLYKGASGQMAVMSEFLYRLINVAVPEVDVGDDIFVIREKDEAVTRVQVKYAKADSQQNNSYVALFNLPWEQFDSPDDIPALVYVLAVRHQDHWTDFLVVRRSVLRQLQANHGIGSVGKNKAGDSTGLVLRLVFTGEDVKAKGGFSLKDYWDAFDPWPPPQLPG